MRQTKRNPEILQGGPNFSFYSNLAQLPPVLATSLFENSSSDFKDVLASVGAYAAIDQTVLFSLAVHVSTLALQEDEEPPGYRTDESSMLSIFKLSKCSAHQIHSAKSQKMKRSIQPRLGGF